jgi:L-lactate dehydrogenase complex protein LldF
MANDLFHTQIRTAIADENLQTALDKNAEMRLIARATAYASLGDDLQILRQRAHEIRADVIANHEHYLDQFIRNAGNNGFIIHRASDAAEAREIVLKIAKKHNAKLIAKSKTMVSEEIELNHALEAAGIQPVETDLGEYIVQLREEPPSHIITPAVHLRKEDVGETFHEKLGIPQTNDIPTMTDAARAALRETFLNADIGLSGVNFGVAEGGAITLVTNEGNGRMVTTVPKVHIALMGIERLAPTYDDLALLLTLLPRAATGQNISVYTQIVHGPRREDEIDGAQERHIVLVDNGRSSIRGTALNDTLLCIRCGACLNACPIFREIGGYTYTSHHGEYTPYPGPIGSALSPALFSQENFGHLAQASTLCGACKEACPVDIDLPTMLLRVRGGMVGERDAESEERGARNGEQKAENAEGTGIPATVSWGLRIFTWFATGSRRFALAQKLAAVFGRFWSPRATWMSIPALTGWGYSKDFPRPAGKTFRDRWREPAPVSGASVSRGAVNRDQVTSDKVTGDQEAGKPIAQSSDHLIAQFQDEIETLGGNFIRCEESELAAKILALLKEKGIDTVLAWDDEHLPTGLAENLRKQGITIHNDAQPQIRAGITGVAAGIAETGTLVITSGEGKPQSTSLLPQIHLAILQKADLHKNLAEVLKLRKVREESAVSLISGPSKTADIEMTLTVGVHGPGEVTVLCI